MKKISFAAFGVVFGGLVVGGADASIISRGFLDEALESYATTTALDLKADKADLTALSDKIGNAWPYMFDMARGLNSLSWGFYPPEMNLENTSDLLRFLFGDATQDAPGVLNMLAESVFSGVDLRTGSFPDDGFKGLLQLTNGWTDSKKRTYLGVKGLNDAISALPSGDMYTSKGLFQLMPEADFTYPETLSDFMASMYDMQAPYPSLSKLADAIFFGTMNNSSVVSEYRVKGLYQITQEIGTLPTGNMPFIPVWTDVLFKQMHQDFGIEPIYPTSLAGLMELLFGNNQKSSVGILQRMVRGFRIDDGIDNLIGLYPNYILAKEANDKIGTLPTGTFDIGNPGLNEMFSDGKSFTVNVPSNSTLSELFRNLYQLDASLPSIADVAYKTMFGGELSQYWAGVYGIPSYKGLIDLTKDVNKIGTLPNGAMPLAPIWSDSLFQYMYQEFGVEPIYPTSLAGLMELLFGKNGTPGILQIMIAGFPILSDNSGDGIGLYHNYNLAKEANDKIGRLPTEYSTVGAALSAMDAKIDAHELPADSDDGQYVLSAKKVGDTITYTWVKMDLTDAEK